MNYFLKTFEAKLRSLRGAATVNQPQPLYYILLAGLCRAAT